MKNNTSCEWTCYSCALPNFSDSFFNQLSVINLSDVNVPNEDIGAPVTIADELSRKLQKYTKNIRIAHLKKTALPGSNLVN